MLRHVFFSCLVPRCQWQLVSCCLCSIHMGWTLADQSSNKETTPGWWSPKPQLQNLWPTESALETRSTSCTNEVNSVMWQWGRRLIYAWWSQTSRWQMLLPNTLPKSGRSWMKCLWCLGSRQAAGHDVTRWQKQRETNATAYVRGMGHHWDCTKSHTPWLHFAQLTHLRL